MIITMALSLRQINKIIKLPELSLDIAQRGNLKTWALAIRTRNTWVKGTHWTPYNDYRTVQVKQVYV